MTSFPHEQPEAAPDVGPEAGAGAAGTAGEDVASEAAPEAGAEATGTTEAAPAGEDTSPAGQPGEAAASPEDDELAKVQQALAERTADLQRLQAEYVNYKRRVDRDRDLVRENATFSVLAALLPVLDDIDRADEHGELTGGFKAVAQSLITVVTGLGLTKYGEKGDEFDPNIHEALMHGHSPDVTTTTVDVVAQPGYRVGDRVVRVAKVTVLDPEE